MKQLTRNTILLVATSALLSSCNTLGSLGSSATTIPGPLIAGGLGAALGAVVLQDDPGKGAALGAVAGYGIAKYSQTKKQTEKLELYSDGYQQGRSDSVKTLYWAQRNAQRDGPPADLEYRYMEVPVAAHVTSDGVFVDEHYRVIEVIE